MAVEAESDQRIHLKSTYSADQGLMKKGMKGSVSLP